MSKALQTVQKQVNINGSKIKLVIPLIRNQNSLSQ